MNIDMVDMGGKGGKQSGPRTLADSLIYYQLASDYYNGFDLMSFVYGNVATIASYDLFDMAGITPEDVGEFCRLRKKVNFSPSYNGTRKIYNNVILPDKSCFENSEGNVFVKPMNLKSEGGKPHFVKFKNWERFDSDPADKIESIKHIRVGCDCERTSWLTICRPPIEQRLEHGDERTYKDIPSPFIEGDFCSHSIVGLNVLNMFYGVEGLNIFGLPKKSVDITRKVVQDIITYRTTPSKIRDHQLNENYQRVLNLQKELFGHLIVLARVPFKEYNAHTSDLITVEGF